MSERTTEWLLLLIGAGFAVLPVLAVSHQPGYMVAVVMGSGGGFLAGTIYGIRKVRSEGAQALLEDAGA